MTTDFCNPSCRELLEQDFPAERLDLLSIDLLPPTADYSNPQSSSSFSSTTDPTASATSSTIQPAGNPFLPAEPNLDPLSPPSQDFPISPKTWASLCPPPDPSSTFRSYNERVDLDPFGEGPTVDQSASSVCTFPMYSNNTLTGTSGTEIEGSFIMPNDQDPSLSDSNNWSGVGYASQHFDSLPCSGSSNSFSLFGQPQQGISLSGGYDSTAQLERTDLFGNYTDMGVDDCQHSNSPLETSMTGHIAYGNMPTMPPTFGALSVDGFPLPSYPSYPSSPPFYNMPWHPPFPGLSSTSSQPFPPTDFSNAMSVSTPSSRRSLRIAQSRLTASSTGGRKRISSYSYNVHMSDSDDDDVDEGCSTLNRHRWRRGKQLVPSEELWERIGRSQWICKYVGPAEPDGCKTVVSSLRNLGRHMRENHARREVAMNLPEAERIAVNSMPEDLLFNHFTCPFEGRNLEKCGYYREHNRRWETKTMLRKEKALKAHAETYHTSRNKRTTKVIKKEPLSDDEYLQ